MSPHLRAVLSHFDKGQGSNLENVEGVKGKLQGHTGELWHFCLDNAIEGHLGNSTCISPCDADEGLLLAYKTSLEMKSTMTECEQVTGNVSSSGESKGRVQLHDAIVECQVALSPSRCRVSVPIGPTSSLKPTSFFLEGS